MMYEVVYSKDAKEDYIDIYDYIGIKLKSPDVAVNLIRKITKAIRELSTMPKRYVITQINSPFYIRYFSIKKYLIYYYVDDNKNIVYILRIVNSKINQFDLVEDLSKQVYDYIDSNFYVHETPAIYHVSK